MAPAAAAASPASAADQTADTIKKSTLDGDVKAHDVAEVTGKTSLVQSGSGTGEGRNVSVPSHVDSNICYYPPTYYYGYDPSGTDWQEYSRYMNQEGVDLGSGAYADIYHNGYGYVPYAVYPTDSNDGQLYGTQHYQYPYYQAPYTPAHTPGAPKSGAGDQTTPAAGTTKAVPNGSTKGNANGSSKSAPLKTSNQNLSVAPNSAHGRGGKPGGHSTSGYQDPRYCSGAVQPWFDSTALSAGRYTPASMTSTFPYNSRNASARNQSQRPASHLLGSHTQRPSSVIGSVTPGLLNKAYPANQMYGPLGTTFRSGYGFGANHYNSRINGYYPVSDNKFRPKARGNGFYGHGNESPDAVGELNRGPRGGRYKNLKAVPNVTDVAKEENQSSIEKENSAPVFPDMELFNREDFPETYLSAKFYIIKSYSEDDVHKSVKYGVWASTPNGNKKLDVAYKEAQEKPGECPVFLLFSVNTSGQFVGLAEMVGPVNFEKSMDYWQQDKWFGCFPVKWHIVKDIPNSLLKHITLEYNENKPVTNSRDTQEVKLEQGLQVLKVFKQHVSKTSILDDFEFYENRQKMMQEKRAKQQLQKQAPDGKTDEAVADVKDKGTKTVKVTLDKPAESVSSLNNEAGENAAGVGSTDVSIDALIIGEQKSSEVNPLGDAHSPPNIVELATEKPADIEGQSVAELLERPADVVGQRVAELAPENPADVDGQSVAELLERPADVVGQRVSELAPEKPADVEGQSVAELLERPADVEGHELAPEKLADVEGQSVAELAPEKLADVEGQSVAELVLERAADVESVAKLATENSADVEGVAYEC